MEIVEEAVMVAKKKGELAIEDYLDFVDDRSLNLTIPQLRQQLLVDMVTTMDLMDLRRSTLLDASVSGDACFTLEEVINDLKDLDWQECHVTSLLTLCRRLLLRRRQRRHRFSEAEKTQKATKEAD
ncbi:UNVERIFIED_CONTAM: hypothetical protein Sradi_5136500 [Sesamum radiatum]|uniref:Uncharacterized protein n=1 Tax=Sesamum radiatum TaxID=300843 RepID=A0AAW2M3M7_SESRA